MQQNHNSISDISNGKIKGKIEFPLTNDYMFKAVFQECQLALKGLIGALLFVSPEVIEVEVINPIELGKSLSSKDFYLDLKVLVDKFKVLNLEMQVRNQGNWNERSLSYATRTFDGLTKGEDYINVIPVHQIGFTSFDIFKKNNKFYDTFFLTNKDHSQIYTDKFLISVVNLKRIDQATRKDKKYKLDKWCRFITARTWEEAYNIAKEDPYMVAALEKLYLLSQDFYTQEEARRREEYYAHVNRLEATIAMQTRDIAVLKAELEKLRSINMNGSDAD